MTYNITLESQPPTHAAVVTETVAVSAIGPFIGEAFGLVMQALQAQRSFPGGPPFASYHMLDGSFVVRAGFPVAQPIAASGRVVPMEFPGGQTVVTMHIGAYDQVAKAYDAIMAWLPGAHLVPAGDPWETYLDGPEVAQPRTQVHLPVRPA